MKINFNRPFINREDITKRQNFQKLLLDYNGMSVSFYKTKWFWGVSGVAAFVAGIVLYSTVFNPSKEQTPATAFINPPIKAVDVRESTFEITASTDTTLHYASGTSIKIPANIFVDEKGKDVTGKVDINYREFHDKVDFFVSGIPMTYDSAGVKYVFESAGMMQINGSVNGNPVFIKEGKNISVSFASRQQGSEYNLYELDTVKKNWVYKGESIVEERGTMQSDTLPVGVDSITPLPYTMEKVSNELTVIKNEINKLQNSIPVLPQKATEERPQFSFDVDPKEFPEIAVYKNVMFEIGKENKNFKANAYDVTYQDVKLEQHVKGKSYKLTLYTVRGKEKTSYTVYPVFEGKNFTEAMEEYKSQFSNYEKTLARRLSEQKKIEEELRAAAKRDQRDMTLTASTENYTGFNMSSEDTLAYKQSVQKALAYSAVYRYIEVNRFGIWNCDRPAVQQIAKTLQAKFTDESGIALNFERLYLTEKERNIIFTYYPGSYAELKYDPRAQNMIWGVTADGKIAVFSYKEFRAIRSERTSFTFKMRVSEVPLKTTEEVRSFINC